MNSKTKSNRGGAREGAGRPKSKEKRVQFSITLKESDIKWLDEQPEKQKYVLFDQAIELLKKEKRFLSI